jgi:hypothetical protein
MTYLEDQLMNFVLYKTAKSFYKLNKFGYYYKRNNVSICKNLFKLSHMRLKFHFIYLKLVFEYSKNTKYEKGMANYLFSRILKKKINIEKELSTYSLNDDFNFYYDIINMLLNCKFISKKNNLILLKLKNIIQKKKNFLKFYRKVASINNNKCY